MLRLVSFFSQKKSLDIVSCYLGDGLMLTSGFTEPRFCPYQLSTVVLSLPVEKFLTVLLNIVRSKHLIILLNS